jgi:ABC-2 type transport system ATP-binding protein
MPRLPAGSGLHPAPLDPSVPTAIRAQGVTKRYRDKVAVRDISFDVLRGDIFGLLGPNGAGKTTTIRMLLGLIAPSEGLITVLDEPVSHAVRRRIGYLPEERGLYRDVPVLDGLVYLAGLKGLGHAVARRRALDGLERLGLPDVARKPVRELSRGMQQKVQFLATVLHEPELLIIDEPFSGLDPVNARVLRDMLLDLHARGMTIVMSAHEMNRVEELCERVLMLQAGRPVLYGELDTLRALFREDSVYIVADGPLDSVPGIDRLVPYRDGQEAFLSRGVASDDLFRRLASIPEVQVRRFEVRVPTLEEIFLAVAGATEAGSP